MNSISILQVEQLYIQMFAACGLSSMILVAFLVGVYSLFPSARGIKNPKAKGEHEKFSYILPSIRQRPNPI
jgi:hypothetical protein